MYTNLISLLNQKEAITWGRAYDFIFHGTEADPEAGLKYYGTSARWEQYKSGKISQVEFAKYTLKLFTKHHDKKAAYKVASVQEAFNAPDLGNIKIVVEWKRSKTWGWNPSVEAAVYDIDGQYIGTYSGYASGCNYDKGSAAIAKALNQFPRKGIIQEDSDADIVILDSNYMPKTVFANGKLMMLDNKIMVKENFSDMYE